MNNNQMKQLDRYSMMIVTKYFKNSKDFIKLIQICKKFEEIPEMYHYNPVRIIKKIKLFPNIETYHIYNKKVRKIEGYDNYVYWYRVIYDIYLNKKENEQFKNVRFSSEDWNKYKSFKGANILCENSLSLLTSDEIDLTGITKLENNCFKGNQYVKYIKLDNRISTIPDHCFINCTSLKELDLSYIKILGNNCFNGCSSLTALTLPEMVYKMGKYCFYGLNELEKIETKGLKVIKKNMNYSLYKSFKRNGIDVKGGILYNKCERNKYGNEIPEEVSIIDSGCFNRVTTIGDVILPKSVTKLEQNSYNYCSIKSIDLSNVLENRCYFEGCNELTSITINKRIIQPSEKNKCSVPFYNYLPTLKNIELIDTDHIPIVSNHLRKLMNEKGYQYDKCIYTKEDRIETNSIIPVEVNIIDEKVFYYDNNLKTITIPSNVTRIHSYNFNSMNNLERIEIQSTNIRCDYSYFNNLPKIKELDLRGITSFGYNFIYNCPSLTKLIINNKPIELLLTNTTLKDIEIIGIENNEYEYPINYKIAKILENKGIHCKRKVFYKYQPTINEESYCIPNGVSEITSYSFQYCQLMEITIPSSVTLINSYSFYCCYNLNHLIIEGNPKIARNAFYGCDQLIQNNPELKQYS